MPRELNRTRLSLYYPATYLLVSGLGLLCAPGAALKLLLSNGSYDPVIVRLCGVFILGLWLLVFETIRRKIDGLYPALIVVRVFFCAAYAVLYLESADPFFLVLIGVVGFGMLMSLVSFLIDRRTVQNTDPSST